MVQQNQVSIYEEFGFLWGNGFLLGIIFLYKIYIGMLNIKKKCWRAIEKAILKCKNFENW